MRKVLDLSVACEKRQWCGRRKLNRRSSGFSLCVWVCWCERQDLKLDLVLVSGGLGVGDWMVRGRSSRMIHM
jgi:hypothetical protein